MPSERDPKKIVTEIIKKMERKESSLRWKLLGSGLQNFPIRIHVFLHRMKKSNPHEMAIREFEIYEQEPIEFLKSELKIYQSLLGGQSSLYNQLFILLSFFLSIIAILLSSKVTITLPINWIIGMLGAGVLVMVLLYFEIKGADLLAVREFHVRTIVLSVLIDRFLTQNQIK